MVTPPPGGAPLPAPLKHEVNLEAAVHPAFCHHGNAEAHHGNEGTRVDTTTDGDARGPGTTDVTASPGGHENAAKVHTDAAGDLGEDDWTRGGASITFVDLISGSVLKFYAPGGFFLFWSTDKELDIKAGLL